MRAIPKGWPACTVGTCDHVADLDPTNLPEDLIGLDLVDDQGRAACSCHPAAEIPTGLDPFPCPHTPEETPS